MSESPLAKYADPSRCPGCETPTPTAVATIMGGFSKDDSYRALLYEAVAALPSGLTGARLTCQSCRRWELHTGIAFMGIEPVALNVPFWRPIPTEARAKAGDTKAKKGKQNSVAREKLISALTKWHKYADGSCLNYDPVGCKELAGLAEVSPGSASNFFKSQFGDENAHAKYQALCGKGSENKLFAFLKNLNREFTPERLYGSAPIEKGGKDHDDESESR